MQILISILCKKPLLNPPDEIPSDRLISVENNGKEDINLFLKSLINKIKA
jgi:hypothetical protein